MNVLWSWLIGLILLGAGVLVYVGDTLTTAAVGGLLAVLGAVTLLEGVVDTVRAVFRNRE